MAIYLYPSAEAAKRFFTHFVKDFSGAFLPGVGDSALITYEEDPANNHTATAIRFLRRRAVVAIKGQANDDPPPARSALTLNALISYAERLDQRLLEFDVG